MQKITMILALVVSCLVSGGQEAILEMLKRVRPNVDAEAMLDYYRKNAPDLLEEIEKRRKAYPEAMDGYLGQLSDHFQEVDRLRGEDNTMYDRLVRQERQQCQVRGLSRDIQKLSKPAKDETNTAAEERVAKLKAARLQLRNLLETAFDEAQQQQLIKINRLESEVQDLRRLATERSKNRMYILKERFRALTGEDWPDDK